MIPPGHASLAAVAQPEERATPNCDDGRSTRSRSARILRRYSNLAERPVSETGYVRVQISGGVPDSGVPRYGASERVEMACGSFSGSGSIAGPARQRLGVSDCTACTERRQALDTSGDSSEVEHRSHKSDAAGSTPALTPALGAGKWEKAKASWFDSTAVKCSNREHPGAFR